MTEEELRVKRCIRALLVSAKHGCTPRQLHTDYEHIVGEPLPYQSFGYKTFMEYLTSVPDVVEVRFSRDCSTILYGVPDSSTEHIAKMVSKQRSKPPARNSQLRRYSSTLELSSASRYGRRPEPRVPQTFKTQMKTLLLSYASGLPLLDFPEAFARRFGYYVNFKIWGYASLDQVMKAISDTVVCESDPIRKCQVIKRAPPPPQVGCPIVRRGSVSGDTARGLGGVQVPSVGQSQGGGPKSVPQNIPLSSPPSRPQNSLHSLELSPTKTKSFLEELRSPPPQPRKKASVPKPLQGKIEQLLKSNAAGIWVSRFPVEFKDYFGVPLPTSSLGFTSVVHLLSSLSFICDLERPLGTGDWLAFAKGSNTTKAGLSHPCISEELVKSIHQVLRAHPNGVPLSRFTKVFQEMVHNELPVEELGFSSVGELLRSVHGVMVVRLEGAGPIMVFLSEDVGGNGTRREDNGVAGMDENTACKEPPTPTPVPPLQRRPSSYQQQLIPSDKKMSPVYITNVKTPSCMSMQLIGETTTKALEYLLEDITQFYNSKAGDVYKLEERELQLGQPCCTVFSNDGYWYRAEITGLPAPDIAEVMYMDYGNSCQVPRGSLRRPKPHYLALPAQAVKSRLANVKPAGSTWSRRATSVLFQMTKDKPIVAIITSMKRDWVSVCLCDTNTARDIHINDTLVSQGLALFSPDTNGDEACYDAFQLEPLPQGSTGDKVPEVRVPTGPSKLELATSSIAATPPAPPLGSPDYLQQVLLLQQQQNALLLGQPSLLHQATPLATPLAGTSSVQAAALEPPRRTSWGNPLGVVPLPPPISVQRESTTSHPNTAANNGQPSLSRGVPKTSLAAVTPPIGAPLSNGPTRTSSYNMTTLSSSSASRVTPFPSPGETKSVQPPLLNQQSSGFASKTAVHPTTATQSPPAKPPPAKATLMEGVAGAGESVPGRSAPAEPHRTSQEEPKNPRELLLVKKIPLTPSHRLHVLRHNNRAHVISAEVSLWLWDSDLLQAMLRQVQKPLWGLLVRRDRVPRLWDAMWRTELSELLQGAREITVYALEDLPGIVSMFHAPPDLCTAVSEEARLWETLGLDYFSPQPTKSQSEKETERLGTALKELQLKRRDLLVAMMHRSDDDTAIGKAPLEQLIEVEKQIADLKSSLSKLKSSSTHREPSQSQSEPRQSETEHSQSQAEPSLSRAKPSQFHAESQADSVQSHAESSQPQAEPPRSQAESQADSVRSHAEPSQPQVEPPRSRAEYRSGELRETAVIVERDPTDWHPSCLGTRPQEAAPAPSQSFDSSAFLSNSSGSLSSAGVAADPSPPPTLPSTTPLVATLSNDLLALPPNAPHFAPLPNLPGTTTVSPIVTPLVSNSLIANSHAVHPSPVNPVRPQHPSVAPLGRGPLPNGHATETQSSVLALTNRSQYPLPVTTFASVPIPVSVPMCSVLPSHLSMPYSSGITPNLTTHYSSGNPSYATTPSSAKPLSLSNGCAPFSMATCNSLTNGCAPFSTATCHSLTNGYAPFSMATCNSLPIAMQPPSLNTSYPTAGNNSCPQPASFGFQVNRTSKPAVSIGLGRGTPLRAGGMGSHLNAAPFKPRVPSPANRMVSWPSSLPVPPLSVPPTTAAAGNLSYAAPFKPHVPSPAVGMVSWPSSLPVPPLPVPPTTAAAGNPSYSNVASSTPAVPVTLSSKHIGLGRGVTKGGGAHAIGLGRGNAPNEDAWQYVRYSRKPKASGNVLFPPIGSGAGLDVI